MPACGYEFYLLVFNSTSHSFVRVEYSNEIKFVSTRGHVISSIFVLCKGIWIPWSDNFCLWNLESWALESRTQLKESGIYQQLESRIQGPLTKKCRIRYLESGIHGMESRIQDCLGFPQMWAIFIIFRKHRLLRQRRRSPLDLDVQQSTQQGRRSSGR